MKNLRPYYFQQDNFRESIKKETLKKVSQKLFFVWFLKVR